jgi:hypothetical protein
MNLHQLRDHPEYVEGCFGCKIGTLQTSTGDANSVKAMATKKWDGELQAYRDARSQGIQPGGTSKRAVEASLKASETLGKAYDGNTMPKANKITKKAAAVMKELGV